MNTCTLCGHGLHDDRALWTTCQPCQIRITTRLDEIEQMWPQLSDCLEPSRGHSGPRPAGPAASLPATEQVLELIGPAGVPARLYWRYADIALARRLQPAVAPAGSDARLSLALRGIRRHLPWAVQAVDLSLLADETRKITGQMTAVTGGAPAVGVPCPAELADGSRCTGRMRYERDRSTAYCRTCRTELLPGEWLEVWVKLGQPA